MNPDLFQPPLRLARPEDAHRLAELANEAGEGIPAYFWSLAAGPGADLLAVGAKNVLSETDNFSYRNMVVVEADGQVVAMVLAYPLPQENEAVGWDDLPPLVRPLIELEQQAPGSFYINMLATLAEYRGRGYGSRLLAAAERMARQAGCRELSIEVFEENTGAVRLYQRHGYRIRDRRPVVPHECYPYTGDVVLLIKPVEGR